MYVHVCSYIILKVEKAEAALMTIKRLLDDEGNDNGEGKYYLMDDTFNIIYFRDQEIFQGI